MAHFRLHQEAVPAVSCLHRAEELHGTLFFCKLSFFNGGIATAPWAALMPYLKIRLNLDALSYALLPLLFGAGSLLCMPLTANAVRHLGLRRVLVAAFLLMYIALAAVSVDGIGFVPALLAVAVWGGMLGVVEVGNNLFGTALEEYSHRRLLNACHGWYTIGCIVAALGCPLLLQAGSPTLWIGLVTFTAGLIMLFISLQQLKLPERREEVSAELKSEQVLAEPLPTEQISAGFKLHGRLLVSVCGLVCAVAYLNEGMVYDWSGIYLIDYGGSAEALASVGYLAFLVAMAAVRIAGARLIALSSERCVLCLGCCGALVATATAALIHDELTIIICFGVLGLSIGNIVPVLFSAVARAFPEDKAGKLAAAGTLGYAGLLAGPALLGLIALWAGLPAVLLSGGMLMAAGVLPVLIIFKPRSSSQRL